MCNAWNHAPNCNCGWGAGIASGGGLNAYTPTNLKKFSTWTKDQYEEAAKAYVNPNAKCPCCGAHVYFYQSPSGGRVFFESLGKPWPRHPCTERQSESVNVGQIELLPPGSRPFRAKGPWQPFICLNGHPAPLLGPNVFVIEGLYDGHELKLFCYEPKLQARAPYLLKREDESVEKFLATTVIYDNGEARTIDFLAFRSVAALTSKRIFTRSREKIAINSKASRFVQDAKRAACSALPATLPSSSQLTEKKDAPKSIGKKAVRELGPSAMELAFQRATRS